MPRKFRLAFVGISREKSHWRSGISNAGARTTRVIRRVMFGGNAERHRPRLVLVPFSALLIVAVLLGLRGRSHAENPCDNPLSRREVATAVSDIEASVDPCGETAAVLDVIREYRRCGTARLRVCTDRHSERNFIERGVGVESEISIITWNPDLRSELEVGCGDDAARAVLRDPTASLLHELVHAVQDCHGLDPAEHEFEAVQIENVYRRARHLCQRTRYGEQPLPRPMLVSCTPEHCSCATTGAGLLTAAAAPAGSGSADQRTAGDLGSARDDSPGTPAAP
jgi:hypothetical protein